MTVAKGKKLLENGDFSISVDNQTKSFYLMAFESFISLSGGLTLADSKIKALETVGLCQHDTNGDAQMTTEGIELQREMRLEARLMKKVKITGDDASVMIDEMMKELN